jgi:peptidoglycan/LPS O-acetylase OafA/YrhL
MTTAVATGASAPAARTTAGERLDYLDGWRGLAISLVLAAHFLPAGDVIDSGRFGVDVFFCLSGFLMSNILFVKRTPLPLFYKRRISRILPVFLLFVAVSFGAYWAATGTISWTELASTAAFLRTYIPATPPLWQAEIPLGHLWSLNAEEHCYVFLSLIASIAFLRRREGWILAAAGVLAIVIHVLYIKVPRFEPPSADLGTEVVASHLLISAGYFLERHRLRRFVKPWMPVVALICAGATYTDLAPWWSDMLLSPFLLAFAINHLADAPAAFRGALATPPLRLMGVWSYSLYIWQQPFYRMQELVWPGVGFAGAMLTGLLSFYLFENPIRNWLNRNW